MTDEYNVFISWSGDRSKHVAEALHEWLPTIVQSARPWMSANDIEKGSRGLAEVVSRLELVKIGITCLTPENLEASWILYEAGALSKVINSKTLLCTYLLGGLTPADVKPPLSMFQATIADANDTRKLMHTINKAVSIGNPVEPARLNLLFDRMWPDLEKKISSMPAADSEATAKRSPEDIMAEILQITRAEATSRRALQEQIKNMEMVLNRLAFGDMAGWGLGVRPTTISRIVASGYNPSSYQPSIFNPAYQSSLVEPVLAPGQAENAAKMAAEEGESASSPAATEVTDTIKSALDKDSSGSAE